MFQSIPKPFCNSPNRGFKERVLMEWINFEADVAKVEHKTGDQSSLNSD